jgi:hypothetical protein
MKRVWVFGAMLGLLSAGPVRANQDSSGALVVTSSNAATNQLLVYDTTGVLVQTLATQGNGGVSGNAGGIAVQKGTVAVVNFGSQSVSLFTRGEGGFSFDQVIQTASAPVSVAFGSDHLYVLGTATVESHRVSGGAVEATPDGVAALLHGDGSAAQVGVVGDGLIVAEKSNVVETVALRSGAVSGPVSPVNLPAGSDTPFGLVTRGANAYVTIAHSDEVTLIKNDDVVSIVRTGIVGGAGQHAPCWIALIGPFLYSANSPSHTISRLVATGQKVLLDEAVAAQTIGAPTDVAAASARLAVIDADGSAARLTQFTVGDDGALTQVAQTVLPTIVANGVAVVE